ncbi:hypothetical protein L1987_03290 [Smallanthus sonchifolius]|uniref:Uncharacterized protein n=1 Tax=Smallanthus sonchifolius TaxID=185202 RepID=A0ACB9KAA4_9ASTR|nr:hypothetical protein L1987_03290 [Smallanthus sonchifolius]
MLIRMGKSGAEVAIGTDRNAAPWPLGGGNQEQKWGPLTDKWNKQSRLPVEGGGGNGDCSGGGYGCEGSSGDGRLDDQGRDRRVSSDEYSKHKKEA